MISRRIQSMLLCLCACFITTVSAWAGGEIPWPLDIQHQLSESSSQGMWFVNVEDESYLYNVEILRSTENLIFVRVSILEFQTKAVVSQGEAFIWNRKDSRDYADPQGADPGAYLFMKPIDSKAKGFFIRAVELKTGLNTTLGLTVFSGFPPFDLLNGVAYRIRRQPMFCDWVPSTGEPTQPPEAGFVCQNLSGMYPKK